eukprot:snap_masked-scaffold_16-processed-gene-3.37-mRNA-1 protein AED:1.00 eAED:1.00 QI:0/0/0/0/1/1/2/0/71
MQTPVLGEWKFYLFANIQFDPKSSNTKHDGDEVQHIPKLKKFQTDLTDEFDFIETVGLTVISIDYAILDIS